MIGLLRVPATAGQAATAQGTPVQSPAGTPQVPLSEFAAIGRGPGPLTVTKQSSSPRSPSASTWLPAPRSARRSTAIRAAEAEIGTARHHRRQLRRRRAEFQRSLRGEPWLILAAIIVSTSCWACSTRA